MKTEKQLVKAGIIKVKDYKYQNASVECYSSGGIRGLWIDNKYYKAIHVFGDTVFDVK